MIIFRCLLALLLACPLALAAQRPQPRSLDTLQASLRRPGLPDTLRVLRLVGISQHYMQDNLDSARWYSQRALAMARQCHFGRGEADALNNLAAACYYSADYPAAQRTFEQSLRAARHQHSLVNAGHAYLGLGNVATALHNAPAAQAYFAQAQQAYAACRPAFVRGEQLVLYNRANGYLDAHQPDSARRLVSQGMALLLRHPEAGRLAKFELLLGTIQELRHQPDSAAATWQRAARRSQATHDPEAEGEAWLNLATLARQRQQPVTALICAQRAASRFRRLADPESLAAALDVQATALAALHRPEAYDTLRRYVRLRDTLFSQASLEAVATAQARFDQATQQARIRALEQQGRIATLVAGQRTLRTRMLLGGLAATALLAGGAVLGAYRRRQQRREAALRHQLATDLHDDVGSLLSQIALQTDLLQEDLDPAAPPPQQWVEIAANSRLAVRQLNDVVWNLDTQNDTLPNLLHRLRDYAHEVLVPTGRDVRFVADDAMGTSPALSAQVRRHLYLIYKEALHNVLKHTPATTLVTVHLHRQGQALVLTVANDGPPPPPGRRSGHGLRNIEERARALHGTAEAGPLPAGGFEVRVEVPVS